MTSTALEHKDSATQSPLYMALELSKSSWKVGFEYNGKRRRESVDGGDIGQLKAALDKARCKFGLERGHQVVSCYEAGRDGFWLHRLLSELGFTNHIVNPASIEVNRKARRAKTDNIDRELLLTKLRQHDQGENVWTVVNVPSVESEALRGLHREIELLKRDRGRLGNYIKARLFAQGVRLEKISLTDWSQQVERFKTYDHQPLSAELQEELKRAGERLRLIQAQLKSLEKTREERVAQAEDDESKPLGMVRQLRSLSGIGEVASWVFVMEFFGWRKFRNGKQVGALAGLTGTPYDSGSSQREQGIGKDGNRRVRSLAVEISWLWLRYQPDSHLSKWFNERFGPSGKRHRRVGIVALARKLLVALWRYLDTGQVPDGARLKAA